jgi:hypothetical protein
MQTPKMVTVARIVGSARSEPKWASAGIIGHAVNANRKRIIRADQSPIGAARLGLVWIPFAGLQRIRGRPFANHDGVTQTVANVQE